MSLRGVLLTAIVSSASAFAQPNVTLDSPYQIRYASNLNAGDSVINITNTGARGAGLSSGVTAAITGAICANVYVFSPDEQMISCCSCPVTPGELARLTAVSDLIGNTLTPTVPTSIVIKLVSSVPVGNTCAGSAASPGALASGMIAWGTSIHAAPTTPVTYAITETPFTPATLSTGEFDRLRTLCTFILANGSGFGVCGTCGVGGLGAAKR
jgi:hypothetical protein